MREFGAFYAFNAHARSRDIIIRSKSAAEQVSIVSIVSASPTLRNAVAFTIPRARDSDSLY
jgi:hypothetical protein